MSRVASVTSKNALSKRFPSSDRRCRRLSGEETADSAYVPDLAPVFTFHSVAASPALKVNSCCEVCQRRTRYAPQRRSRLTSRVLHGQSL